LHALARIATLVALAGLLCGFNDADFIGGLNAYRGEPVRDAITRLGHPVQRASLDGRRIYYWRTGFLGPGLVCKIWGAAQGGIITNWGYQDCAF
jgi:hypothetical protein